MVNPSSYPATKRGYYSYLKAIGVNVDDYKAGYRLLGPISFEEFRSVDRQSIDDKIAHAAHFAEVHHDAYIAADKAGDIDGADFHLHLWDRFAAKFNALVDEKLRIEKPA
jgi:hypothetical protein